MNKILTWCAFLILTISILVCAEEGRPLILVCNDDGIESEGIRHLAAEMAKLGDIMVAAPLHNSSGVGHGITYRVPIAYGRYDKLEEMEAWWVDALPASCVRWALDTRFDGREVDLVVSGINDGANLGAGVYYSGTVGAAREGALHGAVAIAVSMDRGPEMDYAGAAARVRDVARAALALERKPLLLNVNFPAGKIVPATQMEITRLTDMRWKIGYHDRDNPRGGRYFWITYDESSEPEAGSDAAAVRAGRISVTPLLLLERNEEAAAALKNQLAK